MYLIWCIYLQVPTSESVPTYIYVIYGKIPKQKFALKPENERKITSDLHLIKDEELILDTK